MTKITESKKRLFLEGVDDRFTNLLNLAMNGQENIEPLIKHFSEHPDFTLQALVSLGRRRLKYSKTTSKFDIFNALLNTFRRMRRAA